MKIAIIISGFLRTILYNIKKLKKILENHDCEYYLHLSRNEDFDRYNNEKIDINKVIEVVNPIKCILEEEINFDYCKKNINIKRMWYKIFMMGNLVFEYEKIMNFKYDKIGRAHV